MPATSSNPPNLLIVDDDEAIQRLLLIAAQDLGWRPVTAHTGLEALEILDPHIEAVVLDHGLPGINGMETLIRIRKLHPSVPVIMLTGLNDAETAVQALRAGADDYLTKPFELKRLFDLLGKARQERRHAPPPAAVRAKGKSGSKATLQSRNPEFRRLLDHLAKAASLDSTVLLTGESGTGKTHLAREIHRLSPRANGEFITVSCPALPKDLLESELFGHERGAFTGATATRAGRFEQASDGTIFLDEIGDLPQGLQPKLLTVLQDREFFRVGGNTILRTNARVIAATNVDLEQRVAVGKFREDLYYRLNIIELRIPSLRERREDIPDLVSSLLEKIARHRSCEVWQPTPEAAEALVNFSWPGNIRQLQNVLERATTFAEGPTIQKEDLAHLLAGEAPVNSGAPSTRGMTLQEVERDAFIRTYIHSGRNKAKTARELGISERSVYNLLARHGLK